MSYCRWSSDDWQCDVYVYESESGFQTHVANKRRVFNDPLPPKADDVDGWVKRCREVFKLLDRATLVAIDLPEAGASFTHETAGECADNLERLRAIGFNVPQYAIDDLRAEEVSDTQKEAAGQERLSL